MLKIHSQLAVLYTGIVKRAGGSSHRRVRHLIYVCGVSPKSAPIFHFATLLIFQFTIYE